MNGLRKKPTFNELINYLENEQPKIRYPDRTATFLRNCRTVTEFLNRKLESSFASGQGSPASTGFSGKTMLLKSKVLFEFDIFETLNVNDF